MKILFVGDASSYHRTLARGLQTLGHETVVASHGGYWLNIGRDIDLRRRFPGKLGGLDLWLRLQCGIKQRMSGFDVVTIASQSYIELRPARKQWLFDWLSQQPLDILHLVGL